MRTLAGLQSESSAEPGRSFNIYILFKIPSMTHTLFTGGTGGHGGGLGVAVMAIRAAM